MASILSCTTKLRERILVWSVAVLIFISVSSAEKTRCYWCGPLAEQVHRSQRAPPCDSFHLEPRETDCDPGYSHCAIVATSPPYAESRLCVKFYQDECYSLYCNSTKTWRMVCACQGDLCNGAHTERETQAFALVSKFNKNKPRNKRSLISNFMSVKTKNPSDENDNTVIIMGQNLNETKTYQSDQSMELKDNISNPVTATPKRAEDNFIIVHGTLKNVEKNQDHWSKTESHGESTVHNAEVTMSDKDYGKIDTNHTKVDAQVNSTKIDNIEDIKTDKAINTEVTKNSHTEIYKPATVTVEIVKVNQEPNTVTTTTAKSTSLEIVAVHTSVSPRKMPPAEALQQNVTPTKAIEITTMGTVATTTDNENLIVTTTQTNKIENDKLKKKNNSAQISAHVMVCVICFFVYFSV